MHVFLGSMETTYVEATNISSQGQRPMCLVCPHGQKQYPVLSVLKQK